MLLLHIELDHDGERRRWVDNGRTITDGRSWIVPFPHPAISSSTHVSAESVEVRVAERGGDEIRVRIDADRVTVTAGIRGTAPLYLAARGSVLDGSWDVTHLVPHIDSARLADHVVARVLTRQPRYSADTLFPRVLMLTERATAVHDARGLSIRYPEAALHVARPRELRPGVDPVSVATELLGEAIAGSVAPGGLTGVELSGGLDSAVVAHALAQTTGVIAPAALGLLIGGLDGRHQRLRRAAIIERRGLRDAALDATAHPPFVPTGRRGRGVPHDPAAAFYRETFDAMRDRAAHLSLGTVLTGVGGDELLAAPTAASSTVCESSARHRLVAPPWLGRRTRAALDGLDVDVAPVSVLPLPALMSLALHNPAYLEAGIWPVAPLTDPRLLRFAEQLPIEWRRSKRLFRTLLRRAGLPRHVTHPSRPESFSALMQLGLRRHGLQHLSAMLRESILIDAGYVNGDALTTAYHDALTSHRMPSLLCETIALELGLRSLTRTSTGSGPPQSGGQVLAGDPMHAPAPVAGRHFAEVTR